MISLQVFPRIRAVRTRSPDGKIRTAGARVISQSDSGILDSGPLRCFRIKKIKRYSNFLVKHVKRVKIGIAYLKTHLPASVSCPAHLLEADLPRVCWQNKTCHRSSLVSFKHYLKQRYRSEFNLLFNIDLAAS